MYASLSNARTCISIDYLHERTQNALDTKHRIYKTYELWAHLKQVISHIEFIVELFLST